MLKSTYEGQVCSVAATLEVVGERWTLLLLRDAFLGIRRFEEFQRRNGIARNVLAGRLDRLVDEGILRRERYSERPPRDEYRLTEKGIDLWPVIVSLLQWGDKHVNAEQPPMLLRHRGCGGGVTDHRLCDHCGLALEARDVVAERVVPIPA